MLRHFRTGMHFRGLHRKRPIGIILAVHKSSGGFYIFTRPTNGDCVPMPPMWRDILPYRAGLPRQGLCREIFRFCCTVVVALW